ncbi:TatD family hydrolase [Saccharibacillus qingshengii]|uniref:TatD family hydrolase n=1 Tax=Saccharibacillus qingshengii TaxID=1763540 RepID=UPI001551BA91|nr:TatD family hydrolase [Saccharibacillus qingshengii]
MTVKLADTHIHLEQYEPEQASRMLREFQEEGGEFVVAVSMNLESARRTERLAMQAPGLVRPAYGFHPEQPLPTPEEEEALFAWMEARAAAAGREAAEPQVSAAAAPAALSRAEEAAASALGSSPAAAPRMAAVGEVGLPYYSRLEAAERGETLDEAGYVRLLERFVIFAARHDLPIVLHAVYEDADTACDLLERHGIRRAHFHWFKGSPAAVERMITNGYFVSFTPDLLYEEEIRELACRYPDTLVMSETDGPWPFEGPFAGRGTHPSMTADVCREWARLRGIDESTARTLLLDNARRFYAPFQD